MSIHARWASKSLAVNASDLGRHGRPAGRLACWAGAAAVRESVAGGIRRRLSTRMAARLAASLIGGDTTGNSDVLAISVTVFGTVAAGRGPAPRWRARRRRYLGIRRAGRCRHGLSPR